MVPTSTVPCRKVSTTSVTGDSVPVPVTLTTPAAVTVPPFDWYTPSIETSDEFPTVSVSEKLIGLISTQFCVTEFLIEAHMPQEMMNPLLYFFQDIIMYQVTTCSSE